MPICTIQNRLNTNLAIPAPIGRVIGPNKAISMSLSVFDLETATDLTSLINKGHIVLTVANDPNMADALEGGVLSIVSTSVSDASDSADAAAASAAAALVSENAAAATLADAMVKADVRTFSLTLGAEAAEARSVTGLVKDGDNATVAQTATVYVEVVAPTNNKGTITVTTGTGVVVINDATGKVHRAWITTTAGGAFAFDVTDDQVETVLIRVMGTGGALVQTTAAFA